MAKSPDPIVQSIENATDSRAFELLCTDVLAGTTFPGIEPIGGTGDGGRDALYRDDTRVTTTICAFSLRKDWETKLKKDCERIEELGHSCDCVLFATSMQPTPQERDTVEARTEENFGWSLELYGRERLATAIRGRLEHLIEHHPSIFRKSSFRLAGGRMLETTHRDLLLVDHVPSDQAFSHWLSRCLRNFGYDVWCRGVDSTVGEVADTAIRELLARRARHYLPILSSASVKDSRFRGRIEQAVGEERRLLPIKTETEVDLESLSERVRSIGQFEFGKLRAQELRRLNSRLENWGMPKGHEFERGRKEGLQLHQQANFLKNEPEYIISNVFLCTHLPNLVQEYRVREKIKKEQLQMARKQWPFVKVGDHAFSFCSPPVGLDIKTVPLPEVGVVWRNAAYDHFNGKSARDVVSELLRRSLEYAFYKSGLLWCPDRELLYFDSNKYSGKRLPVEIPFGGGTTRAVCGEKHKWRPNGKGEDYNWQLAPECRTYGGFRHPWEFRLRVKIRVTYRDGNPIEPNRVIAFRKHAANGWNQDKFRDLILLAMQHAAGGKTEIVVGEGASRVAIGATPITFEANKSLDEELIPKGASKFAKIASEDGELSDNS